MLGILLLLISLLLYKIAKKWSILLFLFFALQGFYILPGDIWGVKLADLAFIYMIVINIYSAIFEKGDIQYFLYEKMLVNALLIFLLCSVVFSLIHYNFTVFQVFQGGRQLFLFSSYFFLRKVSREDIEWIIKSLFYITLVHAGLYIIQCITNLPILLVTAKEAMNESTGEFRYYNYPMFMTFYLLLALLYPEQIGSRLAKVTIVVMVIATLLTMGRTYIVTNVLVCLIGLLMRGKLSRMVQWGVIAGIAALPLMNVALSRFTEEKTGEDIAQILSGDFTNYAKTGKGGEGNLTYRMAWVYERFLYLKEQPVPEQLFGLGMISDSQFDVVNNKYHFIIGLTNKDGGITQLYTADIAWGNFLTRFGALGTVILLLLWICLFGYLFKLRHLHPVFLCESMFLVQLLFNSFAESHISEPGNLVFPILLCTYGLAIYLTLDDEENEEDEYNAEYKMLETS